MSSEKFFIFCRVWQGKRQKTLYGRGGVSFVLCGTTDATTPEKLNGFGRFGPAPLGFFLYFVPFFFNWARYSRPNFKSDTQGERTTLLPYTHERTNT